MGWKKWPYWLKGGVLIAGIHLLFILILIILRIDMGFYNVWNLLIFFDSAIAWTVCGDNCNAFLNIVIIIFGTMIYFILGVLIGGLVRKIKGN